MGLTRLLFWVPQEEIHHNHDLIATYRHHIMNDMNLFNLHLFVKSYER